MSSEERLKAYKVAREAAIEQLDELYEVHTKLEREILSCITAVISTSRLLEMEVPEKYSLTGNPISINFAIRRIK
jgi:hypothetical protein